MRLFGTLLILAASTACAGEFVTFASGSRLHIDRHDSVEGGKVRLYSGSGYSELAAAQVLGFEPDGALEPAPAPAAEGRPAAETAAAEVSPQDLADRAAEKYGLPRKLVRSVMAAESGFQVGAVSPKGAVGLMQLMPSTAHDLGVDALDPAQNVDAGARYLRDLLLKYDGALWHALAAYNAGPEAVEKYNGIPPYRETIQYINRVNRELKTGATQ